MHVRQSILGPVAVQSRRTVTGIDIGTLVRRLILFDRTIVKSVGLYEVPFLVRTFHSTGLTELVNSGLLSFACPSTFLIVDLKRGGFRHLPPNHFSFAFGSSGNLEEALRRGFRGLQGIPGLRNAERTGLEDLILKSVLPQPSNYGQDLLNQIDGDIRTNTPALKLALVERLRSEEGTRDLSLSGFSVQVEETSPRVFHIRTPLASYGLAPEKSHALLEKALMAVCNLDQRLADMQAYSAITGFLDHEASLLFGRLSGVIAPLNPSRIEDQFQRVIELADVPDFKEGQEIDVERLLKARDSAECREFREWLTSAADMSDDEVKHVVATIRSKMGSIAASNPGKIVRFATTTGVGLIPVVGPIAGAVAGAIDTFLVERVFPKSGVVAFLTETYPSLFVSP